MEMWAARWVLGEGGRSWKSGCMGPTEGGAGPSSRWMLPDPLRMELDPRGDRVPEAAPVLSGGRRPVLELRLHCRCLEDRSESGRTRPQSGGGGGGKGDDGS